MKKKSLKKSIVICASASAYRGVLAVEQELKALGFAVEVPSTAERMRASGDFRVETYKTWFKNPKDFSKKAWLMRNHFRKVKKSDATLVVNKPKNGIKGYIGGATLTEMAVAFDRRKPIYVLHPVSKKLPVFEEVMGFQPIFLNGNIKKIKRT